MQNSETAHNIEAFVTKLRSEGVEAGKAEAARIVKAAEEEAARIRAAAKADAEETLAKANASARQVEAHTKSELELAVRDAVLRLRQAVQQEIRRLIGDRIKEPLQDPAFTKELILEVARQYARSDAGSGSAVCSLPESMFNRLQEELRAALGAELGRSAEVRNGLKTAGFEYSVGDGTIEVTTESVAEVLSDLVGPEIRRLLAKGAGEKQQ